MPRLANGRRSGDQSNDPHWFSVGYVPKKKQYSLRLAVEPAVHEEIAKRAEPWLVYKKKLSNAQQAAQLAFDTLDEARSWLETLKEKREEVRRDVERVRMETLDQSVAKVGEKLRIEQQSKLEAREAEWRAEIDNMKASIEARLSKKRKEIDGGGDIVDNGDDAGGDGSIENETGSTTANSESGKKRKLSSDDAERESKDNGSSKPESGGSCAADTAAAGVVDDTDTSGTAAPDPAETTAPAAATGPQSKNQPTRLSLSAQLLQRKREKEEEAKVSLHWSCFAIRCRRFLIDGSLVI